MTHPRPYAGYWRPWMATWLAGKSRAARTELSRGVVVVKRSRRFRRAVKLRTREAHQP